MSSPSAVQLPAGARAHHVFLMLHFASLFLSCCQGQSGGLCIPSEREALLSFKRDLIDPSDRLSSWVEAPQDADCCNWRGVVCHNTTGHVLELRLPCTHVSVDLFCMDMGLGGKLNPSLQNLKRLTYLDLSFNQFQIQIPAFLGSLKDLRYLNLSNGEFTGMIPHQLGNLSNLQYLDLHASIGLTARSLEWVSGLSSLQYVDLGDADLSGATDWLQATSTLPSLQQLHLCACQLSGSTASSSLKPAQNFSSLRVLDLSWSFHHQYSLVPEWIFSLHGLTSLILSSNNFQGPIPIALSNLTSLRTLDLSANNFSASTTVPKWVCDFKHLEVLNLHQTSMQARIPEAIGNLSSLVTLDLSFNSLQGKIPESFGNLTSLIAVDLSRNSLQDRIPEAMGRFTSLKRLHLSHNQLYGPIPEFIGGLLSLEELSLENNQLNGTLPLSLGQLSNLQDLGTSYNPVSGDVTELHFANLTKLKNLAALGNRFVLKVSPNWVPPFKLQSLFLDSWEMGSQFPRWLRSQKHLHNLHISGSGISSTLPNWFWNSFPQCSYYNLSRNQIHGSLHQFPMDPYVILSLSSNQFSGALPPVSTSLVGLDLSNNSFSGNISHFLCHSPHELKQLEYLNLKSNHLSGDIPNCWENWQYVEIIKLENNQFEGSIPSSIRFLSSLKSLHMRNNHLNGELPGSLGNCGSLVTLDLGENYFAGNIPIWIGKRLASLKFLSLGANRFLGQIPNQLCALTSLQILDLAHNHLSGSIPSCFGNFTSMVIDLQNSSGSIDVFSSNYGSISENALIVTKGMTLEYGNNLGFMTSIDLSDNNLSKEIPREVTRLFGLRSLNLSNNHLTGKIPKTIGAMRSLESVDFSVNQISGQIPLGMSSLTFLSHLNLSNNNLVGRIPSSTQLQGFNPTCFVGNNLCGPPLTNSCSINHVLPEVEHEQGIDRDGLEVEGFYVSMIIGFIVGFWCVCAPLLFIKSWRLAYFRSLETLWKRVSTSI